jgi:N-acetylglucosamine-6-phosphate deacetylase
MKALGLVNSTIITGGELLHGKALIIKGSKIIDVTDQNTLPIDMERIDLQGQYLSPGLIDIQVNGAGGALCGTDFTVEKLGIMAQALLKQGTTGFLVTAATNTLAEYRNIIGCGVNYRKEALPNFLGLHIEGPYINPLSKGAHPESLIRHATLPEVEELVEAAHKEIRIMTMAPELQPEEVIRYLDSQNIVVSIGHSAASYEEALHFLTGRKRMATHLYNGMQPMHHRHPGLIPAIFRCKPFTGIVADGIHVSFPMVRLAKQILGDSLILVTDAVTACQTGAYHHILKGDHYVTIGADGKETISGSALTMLKAVKNCVEHVGIPLAEAINMASLYPAQSLNMADHLGQIRKDFDANLLVFDPNFEVSNVYLEGKPLSEH